MLRIQIQTTSLILLEIFYRTGNRAIGIRECAQDER